MKNGKHTLRLRLHGYDIEEQDFEIGDGENKNISLSLTPLFGTLTIVTQPEADIYIAGQKKGNGTWQGRLLKGVYGIEIKKDKYYTAKKNYNMEIGVYDELLIRVEPRVGTLAVESVPPGAMLYIDGEKKGETPLYVHQLIIGSHDIELQNTGYATVKKNITIKEGETIQVTEILQSEKNIIIETAPSDAMVYLDGEYKGTSPLDIQLLFDKVHTLKISKEGYTSESQNISADMLGNLISIQLLQGKNITIDTTPSGANVYVDGEYKGTSPLNIYLPLDGDHTLKVTKRGYISQFETISADTQGQEVYIQLPKRKPNFFRIILYLLLPLKLLLDL